MKLKYLCVAYALFAFVPLYCTAADEVKKTESRDMDFYLSRLSRTLPNSVRTAQRPEKIDNPELSKAPVFGIRTVFTREYMTETTPSQGSYAGATRRVKAYDYTNVMMIPVESTFRIDKSLALSSKQSSETKLDFKQYGLNWRRLENEYHTDVLYLGTDGVYYYFAHGTLPNLVAIKRALGLRDGFDEPEIIAEALNISDKEDFTKKFAVVALAQIKDPAIPYIKGAIREAKKLDAGLYQHFQALCLINTQKAVDTLSEYASEENPDVYLAVFDSVITGTRPRKEFTPVYIRMVETMAVIPYAIEAAKSAGVAKSLLPALREAASEPDTFEHYSLATTGAFSIENPERKTIHQDALKQIMLLLMRNGEVANSIKTVSIDNKTPEGKELELAKDDRERTRPFIEAVLQSPDTILNIVCALSMVTFDTPDRRVASSYILRVRMYGIEMLEKMPKQAVKTEMMKLIRGLKKNSEKELLRSAYFEMFGNE